MSLLSIKVIKSGPIVKLASLEDKMAFHSQLKLSSRLYFAFSKHCTDDSWLNLTDQDLDDILSKYSDPNSSENGAESTAQSNVSTCNLGVELRPRTQHNYPPPRSNVKHK